MILMESMIEKTYSTVRGTIHYRIGAQNGGDYTQGRVTAV